MNCPWRKETPEAGWRGRQEDAHAAARPTPGHPGREHMRAGALLSPPKLNGCVAGEGRWGEPVRVEGLAGGG